MPEAARASTSNRKREAVDFTAMDWIGETLQTVEGGCRCRPTLISSSFHSSALASVLLLLSCCSRIGFSENRGRENFSIIGMGGKILASSTSALVPRQKIVSLTWLTIFFSGKILGLFWSKEKNLAVFH